MGKLDLAMIFLLIAGSYTPVALLALRPPLSTVVLWLVWGAAAAGIVLKLAWTSPPKWASAVVYVAMGSIGAFFLPEVARSVGAAAVALFVAGGVLYILGALVYALQRPDPMPAVFGYHEIFHALVVVAAAVHFVAVAAYLLPATA
jgi:hemolysin III